MHFSQHGSCVLEKWSLTNANQWKCRQIRISAVSRSSVHFTSLPLVSVLCQLGPLPQSAEHGANNARVMSSSLIRTNFFPHFLGIITYLKVKCKAQTTSAHIDNRMRGHSRSLLGGILKSVRIVSVFIWSESNATSSVESLGILLYPAEYTLEYEPNSCNPFTPESDEVQTSPAASPVISYHTV